MDNLGRRLKKIREKTRFTQEEIAGMLGVRRLVITNIENGTRKITADELYFFSKIYGLSMEELYTGEDREKRIAKFSRTLCQVKFILHQARVIPTLPPLKQGQECVYLITVCLGYIVLKREDGSSSVEGD